MEKAIILKKQEEVAALSEKFKASKTIVCCDYSGLTVFEFTELRCALRAAGCDIKVYKNNITRRAAEAAGYDGFASELTGPKAVATSSVDVVAPAKILYDFAAKNAKLVLHGGVVEGKAVGVEQITELATLPSYETLLTQLAAGMLAPIRDIAVGLNMLTEKEEANA